MRRLKTSGVHYVHAKRGGKQFRQQFRRSLKTKDRKLAGRRLNDLRAKIGCLKISADAKLSFEKTANLWLETNKHALSSHTVKRRKMYIKGRTPYFRNLPIRNITEQDCDRWVKALVFLTNNFAVPALTIAKRYRGRWQIELFFKWIKQHLRIKAFYGTSPT